ncbi:MULTISPECIES: M23 family metallopeptidase [Asticcacaulis]|uniref:M23 family metallopeptidase n=1 Tax=Asticcacaulis TaxID=76890 RepID=UPI001AE7F31D|nr:MULTISPECIES: peptidoglycan DD-metalloendopeptidase family protein [Asticcacaulis]MBP2158177.1 murein DD-endopeptidase MepM/ murein hydrolase activator NlpD [Asticcacaulis solisilvae]MDR6799222.1 murein DD-endopeptidase MepM/ murein hydrolase activator NlpD [Asticcacaulis sp. BE141]
MSKSLFKRVGELAESVFPERHLYIRSGGETHGHVLTTGKQAVLFLIVSAILCWLLVSTSFAVFFTTTQGSSAENQMRMMKAQSERWIADRQARLDLAMQQANANTGSLEDLANTVEKRHNALAQVLKDFKGVPGAAAALSPAPIDANLPPVERIYSIRAEQERMISQAEVFAKTRAERLRLAFRLAGLNPASFAGGGQAGPLAGKDAKALSVILGVDEDFAERISNAANDLSDMRGLQRNSERIPFGRPTIGTRTTSGFGVRFDPFNRTPRFHQGQDFSGAYLTPIYATAPGVVAFVGVRSGYGNCVEIDHGNGFKTRYAHLAAFSVRAGQRVAVDQRIASMGNSGRSTGTHLHYEVWINSRPQNPARFLKAGDYVQQN